MIVLSKFIYLISFFNSESAALATLNLVSAAATIKCINISELGNKPPIRNLTMPSFVFSNCSALGGFSPIILLNEYSLIPGGTGY